MDTIPYSAADAIGIFDSEKLLNATVQFRKTIASKIAGYQAAFDDPAYRGLKLYNPVPDDDGLVNADFHKVAEQYQYSVRMYSEHGTAQSRIEMILHEVYEALFELEDVSDGFHLSIYRRVITRLDAVEKLLEQLAPAKLQLESTHQNVDMFVTLLKDTNSKEKAECFRRLTVRVQQREQADQVRSKLANKRVCVAIFEYLFERISSDSLISIRELAPLIGKRNRSTRDSDQHVDDQSIQKRLRDLESILLESGTSLRLERVAKRQHQTDSELVRLFWQTEHAEVPLNSAN